MKNNNVIKIALGVGLAFQVSAVAENNGDWCSMLQSKPKLYKNSDNPYIQEIGIEGRFQWQTAHIEGNDVNGNDVSETFDEYRRVRLGTKVKFLNYFAAKYQINLVSDGRPSGNELDWGYDSIDEAYVTFDLGKALSTQYFDELNVGYGRYKYTLGYESTASSKKLLTVERSALSNKAYGSARLTGFKAEAVKGDWDFGAAVYSSSQDGSDHEAFGSWQDGEILWVHAGYKASDNLSYGFDAAYNNADRTTGEDDELGYDWATSLNAHYENGRFGLVGDFIVGDNGDQSNASREGNFYGFMAMPYYWLIEDKLQAVAQFQHMASSDDNGVRSNSRYGNRLHSQEGGFNSGRGDSHQSVYTGLNYYLCDHNAKFQGGVEYQQMDTPTGDFDTLTYILAFRSYF